MTDSVESLTPSNPSGILRDKRNPYRPLGQNNSSRLGPQQQHPETKPSSNLRPISAQYDYLQKYSQNQTPSNLQPL